MNRMSKLTDFIHKAEIVFWTGLIALMKNPRTLRLVLISGLVLVGLTLLFSTFVGKAPARAELGAALTVSSPAPVSSDYSIIVPDQNLPGGQRNLLFILVDSLTATSPKLVGLWLVGKSNAAPQVVLLPLYPDLEKSEPLFSPDSNFLTPDGQLTDVFLNNLSLKKIWWDHYLIADQATLNELYILVGGVGSDAREIVDGRVIHELPDPGAAPRAALRAQAQIVMELCQNAPELIINADPEILWGLFAFRMRSDLDLENIRAVREALLQPDGHPVCELPRLNEVTFWTGVD